MHRVYTHASKAHMDEVMACAVILMFYPDYTIVRTNELPENIDDTDFVVDIGMEYDGKRKFDHHQLDQKVFHCSFSLVVDSFCPEFKKYPEFKDFLDYVTQVDLNGPDSITDVPVQTAHTLTFLNKELVRMFEKKPNTVAGYISELFSFMKRDKARVAKERDQALAWLEKHSSIKELSFDGNGRSRIIVKMLMFDKDFREDGINESALNYVQTPMLEAEEIDVVFSWDTRDDTGETRKLFRTQWGADKLDFSGLDIPGLKFSHKGGFLVTFVSKNPHHYMKYLLKAVINKEKKWLST